MTYARLNALSDRAAAGVAIYRNVLNARHFYTDGRVALPPLETDYSWIDTGAPETLAHDLVFRLMTPHQALAIALNAEKRAKAFFEQAERVADDPALRVLSREMAGEEAEHIAMLEALLARTPEAVVDWASIYQAR